MAGVTCETNLIRYVLKGVDLLATSTTILVPAQSGRKFIAQGVVCHVRTLTGTFLVAPILRLGNNGNHDNVAPLFTVGLTNVVDNVLSLVLATTPTAIDVGTTGISLEVQTAGTATTMTADVHIYGILV